MLLYTTSYGRAGLLGNPSDGYFGKTISLTMAEFPAQITIYESPEIHLVPNIEDNGDFDSLEQMVNEIDRFGYYGGVRLVKATCRQFFKYCQAHDIVLPKRNFTLRYKTTVPQLVGLGGSSAICTATLKALMRFYEVTEIPQPLTPTLCWRAETDLGINCGLQDRVIQMYSGLMYMDFDEDYFKQHDHGIYERLDPALLPPIYMAYDPNRAEFSGIYHHKLRVLYEGHKQDIVAAMGEFADIARQGKEAILHQNHAELERLINANFDLRCKVLNVAEENARMVMAARSAGASAKFAGSGGAIIGTYHSDEMLQQLRLKLGDIGCTVITPHVVPAES